MDNVVTISGPFDPSPTVRHCELGAHRLPDDQPWWQITDFTRGWPDGKGTACAAHLADLQSSFRDGHLYTVGGLFDTERTNWPDGPHLWMDNADVPVRLAIFLTVLGFNLFGDGLRDALDPRLK